MQGEYLYEIYCSSENLTFYTIKYQLQKSAIYLAWKVQKYNEESKY